MLIQIDPTRERFLADHAVGGSPLLPTVMALDLIVAAADPRRPPSARLVVRDLEVGPPILVPGTEQLFLDVRVGQPATTGARVCEIVSPETGVVHYRAVIETRVGRMTNTLPQPAWPSQLVVQADVYPPFFHGPTFQVVGRLGRVGDRVVASMADELPPLRWSSRSLQVRPRLLELLMQACGLADYAESGRMMIPSRIDQMTWFAGAHRQIADGREEPAVAHIFARPGIRNSVPAAAAFDGLVVAASGDVLLTVEGYHAVDLGMPRDPVGAASLRAQLDSVYAFSATDVPQSEGVRP